MKNRFSDKLLIMGVLLAALLYPLSASGGQDRGNYQNDVEREAGSPLTDEEKNIVDVVFVFYNAYYGHPVKDITPQKAAQNMNAEEYANTVRQAAKISKNPAAKGIQSTGKAGEKLLKALIIATEDAAKAAGTWIDKKSDEYDKRKK